jgi:hypothetical protein
MRHLVGVILAVVMAVAVYFAASWGYLKLLTRPGRLGALQAGGSLLHDHAVLEGLGALAAAGLLAGLLIAVPRVSPLASGLPGLILIAWTALYLFSARLAIRYIPLKTRPYGAGFEALLLDGLLALAGLAMIVPLFVPSRWRRRPAAVPYARAEPPTAAYPAFPATQTMHAEDLFSGNAPTRPQPRIDPDDPGVPGRPQAPWGPAEYG